LFADLPNSQFPSDMKKIFILPPLISFALICSCQKQDSAAEQQLAQRKVELDAREDALDEKVNALNEKINALDQRVNALAESEKSRANVPTISPDAQSQDVSRDDAEAKVERDRRIQEFRDAMRARILDPSQMDAAKVEKERMTRDPAAHRQDAQQQSQSQKQYKFQQPQKPWISGAAASPPPRPAAPGTSSASDASSQMSSPGAEAASPTASPTPQ
jgi:ribonuclease HII